MSIMSATPTLASKLWPASSRSFARNAVLAVAGSLLVAGCAQISVPMFPVPMTLQSLAVLLVGSAYGARLGAITLMLYALEGAVGLPVFSQWHGGLAYMMGPTGGYIIGFIVAAAVAGYLAERGWNRQVGTSFAAMLLAATALYIPGLLWLTAWLVAAKSLSFGAAGIAAISSGLMPFVVGDIVKAALAACGLPLANRMIDKK